MTDLELQSTPSSAPSLFPVWEVDQEGDGQVSFREFMRMLTYDHGQQALNTFDSRLSL